MNTDNILIDNQEIENAQNLCSEIDDELARNRAVANVLAANIALSAFDDDVYIADAISGLHNIPFILTDVDISDVYINGSYIDVRFYFEGDSPCVPKSHFDYDILPVAYMFIKLNEDISNGVITGFILPKHVSRDKEVEGYYQLDEFSLVSFYDIEDSIVNVEDEHNITDADLYDFVDGKVDKNELCKKLIKSIDARRKLAKIVKAKNVFNFVSINEQDIRPVQQDGFDELISESDKMYNDVNEYNSETDDTPKYSTVTTPSLTADDLDNENYVSETEISENEEQIETLFGEEGSNETDDIQENVEEEHTDTVKKNKKTSPVLILLLLVVLGGAGFYYYSNFVQNAVTEDITENYTPTEETDNKNVSEDKIGEEAMPIESVDKTAKAKKTEEAASVSIPAIENNLDTSVLVSNLKIDWEVPSGYTSNTSAKRYLVKLGKIIQLNLKTELLLLNRPPITNRITVEIKYNNNLKKFETVGIVASSGEKAIDDVIMQTINKALNMSISVNTDSFNKLQGNPILIIKL